MESWMKAASSSGLDMSPHNTIATVSIGTEILPEGNLQSILECLVC